MGAGERRLWELFNGYRFSVFQNEKHSGDCLHKNVNVLYITEFSLKND